MRLTLRERLRLIHFPAVRLAFAVVAVFVVTLTGCGGARPESGTIVVLLGASSPTAASGAIEIHSAQGWSAIGRFGGSVPAAPQTVQAAAATLAAGSYDALSLGGEHVAIDISVSPQLVEPVLLGVSQSKAVSSEAYAGQASVNVGLRELSGRYPRLPAVQLQDQHGNATQTAAWVGSTTVLTDFSTQPAGAAAAVVDLFRQLRTKLQSSRLVEIATDPAVDTPNALGAYAQKNGVTWTLATGSASAVGAVLGAVGGAPTDGAGESAAQVLAIIDVHGFVLRTFRAVPSSAQVLDAFATLDSSLPAAQTDRPEPSFQLQAWNGTTLGPGSFGGRPLVINFWASWCDPCRTEMPLLQAAATRTPSTAFLFVDERDQQSAARTFISALGITAPVGSDPDGSVAALFDIVGVPSTIFVTTTGVIKDIQIGQLNQSTLSQDLADIAPG